MDTGSLDAVEHHHATLLEAIADAIPEAPALVCGDRVVTWHQMDDRAAGVAAALEGTGLAPGARVAIDLYNCNEWIESYFGVMKAWLVPVAINYRYLDDELAYLLEDSDSEALIFHAGLGDRVVRVSERFPAIKALVQVDDVGGSRVPAGAFDYTEIVTNGARAARISRSPDDTTMWYSGGTTGKPKGIVVPIGHSVDLSASRAGRLQTLGRFEAAPETIPDDPVEHARTLWTAGGRPVAIPASPLMHSTAIYFAGTAILHCGGTIATLPGGRFDAHELWEVVERQRVSTITIVGDAFAKPMTRALEERAPRDALYHASSVQTIISAGALWSADVKDRIFPHLPDVALVDNCGSSEGAWYGTAVLRRGDVTTSSTFPSAAPGVLVLDESGMPSPPGVAGLLASPTTFAGYHKDPEKTAEAFRYIDDVWYTVPGDYGILGADGTLTLLGRGTSVINTGGEKVYPEEVDDVIMAMAGVDDCLVLGCPDERFGEAVAAVVQPYAGATVAPADVVEWVRARLAHYKAPRRVLIVERVPRLASGKPDYPAARALLEST